MQASVSGQLQQQVGALSQQLADTLRQNQELRGQVNFMAEEVRQHSNGMKSVQQQLGEAGQRNHDLRDQVARLVDDIGRSGAERAGQSQQQVRMGRQNIAGLAMTA